MINILIFIISITNLNLETDLGWDIWVNAPLQFLMSTEAYLRAHDNGRTSDILRTFTLISGQLVTWPEYMTVMPVWRIQLPLSQAFC